MRVKTIARRWRNDRYCFFRSFGSLVTSALILSQEPFAACTSVPRSICPSELGVADPVGEVEDKVALEVADDSE